MFLAFAKAKHALYSKSLFSLKSSWLVKKKKVVHLAYIWVLSHGLKLEIIELPIFSQVANNFFFWKLCSEVIHPDFVKQNCPFIFLF